MLGIFGGLSVLEGSTSRAHPELGTCRDNVEGDQVGWTGALRMGGIWHLGYWNSNGLLLFQCLILFLGWKDWYESFRSLLWTWSCGLRLELEHSEIRNSGFKAGRFMTVCACEHCVLCLCSLLWDTGCLWHWFGRLHVYLWSGMSEDCTPEKFASLLTLKWWCGSFWDWLRRWGQPHMGEEREIGWLWYFHSHFLMPFSLLY